MRALVLFTLLFFTNIGLSQNLYNYYLTKASVSIQQGQHEEADFYINKAIKYYPDSAECYVQKGGNLYFMSELDSALVSFEKAVQLGSDNHTIYKYRGMINHRQDRLTLAMEDYRKYLDARPNDSLITIKLARVLFELDKIEKAEELLDGFETNNLEFAEGYLVLADVYEKKAEYTDAIYHVDRLISLDSTMAVDYERRAYLHFQNGDTTKACEDLHRAIEMTRYQSKFYYDELNCHEVLRVGQKGSKFNFLKPPPEIIIEEEVIEEEGND